ncbi:MAG: hypothetical protein JOZ08_04160 [Verrucomicrobia bacterium]|nr:hypothetical protein [Verrucomicrobiota bacterium]MBV8276062.1 hypothetical protein [Verrucomicrobiota bacterium]
MDKKARLLRFACVLVSLELAIMVASLVTGAMASAYADVAVNTTPSPLDCASNWLMVCHNILEIGFYAVFAWLLIDDNGPYAVTGFLFGLVGLIALSLSIIIELEFLHKQPQPAEPFGFGYAAMDAELGLIGQFSILPANGFFALAALRHPQSRPAVPAILFMGIPIGFINLFIPDDASGWLQFLGDWMVPLFVVCKQFILLWWFVTLLNPRVAPLQSTSRSDALVEAQLGNGFLEPMAPRVDLRSSASHRSS